MHLPKIIVSDQIEPGTILFIPAVEKVRVENAQTGETREYLRWNPKEGAVIKNVEVLK